MHNKFSRILYILLLAGCLPTFAQPTFNKEHGLYRTGFNLRMTPSEAGTEVRYTLDGSEPTAKSTLFTTTLYIRSTTIIRAAEFKNGEKVTATATTTYIYPSDVVNETNSPEGYPTTWGKFTSMSGTAPADYGMDHEMAADRTLSNKISQGLYTLPVLSIVTDKENLFNKTKDANTGGIYIYTGTSDSNGRGWERPASVELFGGDQEHDLSIRCALKLHGGQGRVPEKNPKHSFRLTFKSEYGPSKLLYPLYGEDGVEEYNSLIVRTYYNFSWIHTEETQRTQAQYTRDLWARRMQKRMGHPTSDGFYVHVFLNGMYWGLYNLAERIDDNYCKNHFGSKKANYDVVKYEDYLEASEGNLDRWNELIRLAERVPSNEQYYQMILGKEAISDTREPEVYLDVDNFIDYMLINQYAGNNDWDHHNWIAFKNREDLTQGFRFVCWDSENTFNSVSNNVLSVNNKSCPSYIFQQLMKNRSFLHRYMDRAYKHLTNNGLLTEKNAQVLWDSLYNTISGALYDEAARWGDYRRDVHPYSSKGKLYTVDNQYQTERKRILTEYFPQRTSKLIQQLKDKGWYSKLAAPAILVDGKTPTSDTITVDSKISLTNGSYILYTLDGSDPVSWENSASGTPTPTSVLFSKENILDNLNDAEGWITIRAIAKSSSTWSPCIEQKFYLNSSTGILDMADDEVVKESSTGTYNLSGQRLPEGKETRGIVIKNGKKILKMQK